MSEKESKRLTRRDFVKGATVGAVGGLVVGGPGAALAQREPSLPEKWDYEADVVVIGGGGAGLAAAYEAANAGAKVILLEKQDNLDGSNTAQCYGDIGAAGTSLQKRKGIQDSSDLYYKDMTAGNPRGNKDLIRMAADNSGATVEWLIELGMTFQDWSPVARPGMSAPRAHVAKPDARQWIKVVSDAAKAKGVQILLRTPVTRLIRDLTNGVIGVKADSLTFKARRSIVLCTGDQNANAIMKAKFGSPEWFTAIPSAGSVGNTGDGLTMAMDIGADPMCLDMPWSPSPALHIFVGNGNKGVEATYSAGGGVYPGILNVSILVNSDGNRFSNELGDVGPAAYKQPGRVAFLIFDSQIPKGNPNFGAGASYRNFNDYMSAGVIKQADTIADLAAKWGINPSGLTATIAKYNVYVDAKKDGDFRRDPSAMVKIETPPFFAAGRFMVTSGTAANGTLTVDTKTLNVLDVFGNKIPRLYAAGDNGKAGFVGLGHGTHINWCFTSGRVAGKYAAAEKPWV